MTQKKIFPVILSGGSGVRLWPTSREMFPKQFQCLFGDKSLFSETIKRFQHNNYEKITIITNYDFRFLVKDLLENENIISDDILVEPLSKIRLLQSF